MHSYIVTRTTWLSGQIQQAQGTAALEEDVSAFVEVLECFPDYPATTFSPASLQRVQDQAEGVIETVERTVQDSPDDRRSQRLVAHIYAIRRAVEEIDRWQKHYIGYMKRRSA
jgi:hypothetical protein